MFSRNIGFAVENSINCWKPLLKPSPNNRACARFQLRSFFHNARRGPRRPVLEADPVANFQLDSRPLHASRLFKPFVFTVGVSTASLIGCVIWEYENIRNHALHVLRKPGTWLSAQQRKLLPHFNQKADPGPVKKWWSSLSDADKIFYPILAANVLVFGAWQLKRFQPFMLKYFCSNPSSGNICLPMVLSTFSHYSPLHLAANMYVLYTFMPAAVSAMGKEQMVAMYLAGGVISSFSSILYKVLLNQPGLSLGASGAIMSVLSYVCMQYPDTKLSIIFLPMFTFAAGSAIKVIMSIDLAGVIFGFKFFDHAAHLGGALFGIAWCHWGGHHVWGNRDKLLQYYHSVRKNDGR